MRIKRDFVETAHEVFRKSIGEEETPDEQRKNPAAVEMGSKGGKARADKLTAAERKDAASKAAKARWGK